MQVLKPIKTGCWLSRDRLINYPKIFLVLYVVAAVAWLSMANGNVDRLGRPIGTDFISFYAAGKLAAEGHPASAYFPQIHYKTEQRVIGRASPNDSDDEGVSGSGTEFAYYSFNYPPMFLLGLRLLAELPYMAALMLWSVVGIAFYLSMIRNLSKDKAGKDKSWIDATIGVNVGGQSDARILPGNDVVLLALAFPAVFLTLEHGQNAFFTAGLFAGMLCIWIANRYSPGY